MVSKRVQLEMIAKGNFYAVDLGSNGKAAIHGPDGPVVLPALARSRKVKLTPAHKEFNSAEKFAENFRVLLQGEKTLFDGLPALPIVTEASTIGTCGVEPAILWSTISSSEFDVWKISCRANKNYRKDTVSLDADGRLPAGTDAEAAEIIYKLAKENQDRLRLYKGPVKNHVEPQYRTVRPYDKRDYKDPVVEALMGKLPSYSTLCPDLKILLGDRKTKTYAHARAFPLAQSMDEGDWSSDRAKWEKLVGLESNGRSCHYRRCIEVIRQGAAKIIAGATKNCDVSVQQRKESWRLTRKLLREFYHLAQGTSDPVKGTTHPVSSGSTILADLCAAHGLKEYDSLFSKEGE